AASASTGFLCGGGDVFGRLANRHPGAVADVERGIILSGVVFRGSRSLVVNLLGLGRISWFRVVGSGLGRLSRLLDFYLPDRLRLSGLVLGLDVVNGRRLTGLVVVIDDVPFLRTVLVGLGAAADRLFLLLGLYFRGNFSVGLAFSKVVDPLGRDHLVVGPNRARGGAQS